MAEEEPLFKAPVELGQELARQRREALKVQKGQAPFGEERVGAEAMRRRLAESPKLREKMLNAPGGREAIMALLRGRKKE